MNQKKETILRKMQKAEEKREIQLRLKAQKAHEEEAKVVNIIWEIFISFNSLFYFAFSQILYLFLHLRNNHDLKKRYI